MNTFHGFSPLTFGATKKTKKPTSTKGAKGSLFSPGGSPGQLWMRDPSKRRVDISGIFSPEDTIIAIARGMAPGVMDRMEDRATIRGGVSALKALGIQPWAARSVTGLQSKTTQGPKEDAALIKAAGKGKSLREAAKYIQGAVHKHRLDKAAWGARQGYILGNITGFQIVHGVVASALNLIPAAGQIASATAAAHIAISSAVAKKVSTDAAHNVTDGLAYAKKWKAAKAKKSAKASSSGTSLVKPVVTSTSTASRTTSPSSSDTVEEMDEGTSTSTPRSQGQGMSRGARTTSASGSEFTPSSSSSSQTPWLVIGGVAAVGGAILLVMSRKGAASSSSSESGTRTVRLVRKSKP